MLRTWVVLIGLLLAAMGARAQAPSAAMGMDVLELPAPAPAKITLFYPSSSAEATRTLGPFVFSAANNGEYLPAAVPRRLVVVSHGSGGSAHSFADAARVLVASGMVVAVPQHDGDHSGDMSRVGPSAWRTRPAEISAAIDALAAHTVWGARLNTQRVGLYGMSAGGLTALVHAGGVWSAARFGQHCRDHIEADFYTCVGLITQLSGSWLDSVKLAVARAVHIVRFTDTTPLAHHDPRIAAVVSAVPMAAPFDASSLVKPRVPLALVAAQQDAWLVPKFHSDRIRAACEPSGGCTVLADWADGGHASVLSPWPPELAKRISPIMQDPPAFDRAKALPDLWGKMAAFFQQHLS